MADHIIAMDRDSIYIIDAREAHHSRARWCITRVTNA